MARRRNVQEQNALTLEKLFAVASKVRQEGLPESAERFLTERVIDLTASAVVFVQTESYMLGLEHGIAAFIASPGPRIWEIELELDESLKNVLSVIEFSDVTNTQNLSQHNPGYGWGGGALAIEVMRRLNEA